MSPSVKIRDFLDQYQHKLQLEFTSGKVGLDRQIMLSRHEAAIVPSTSRFGCGVTPPTTSM